MTEPRSLAPAGVPSGSGNRIPTRDRADRSRLRTVTPLLAASLLIGDSTEMRALRAEAPALAAWVRPFVIEGASGSGKTLLAEEVIRHLPEGTNYAMYSCTELNGQLARSELFGYVRGAFTGADRDTPGLIEQLDVLVLDEFQDASLEQLQPLLLLVTEQRSFHRVGAKVSLPTNVRIIVCTQTPLPRLMADGKLRGDLYARVDGVTKVMPTLDQRRGDVPLLARHILTKLARDLKSVVPAVEVEAMTLMERYSWPLNVRELIRVLEKGTYEARRRDPEGPVIEVRDLPAEIRALYNRPGRGRPRGVSDARVREAYQQTRCVETTARLCGVSVKTIRRRLAVRSC